MAGEAGRLSRLYASTDGGTIYSLIGCLGDSTTDKAMSVIDTTCKQDGQNTTAIAGKRTTTIAANWNYVEDDNGQTKVRGVFNGTGSGLRLKWMFALETGRKQFEADALVTDISQGMPNEGKSTEDASFQITGAITESTQS